MSELVRWFGSRHTPFELLERLFEGDAATTTAIKVEELVEGNTLVVRAELPGIDPDKDVDVSVMDGSLHIQARREEKKEEKTRGRYRSEFRYGSFARTLPLPEGVTQDQISAAYKDGVLEVRMPVPEQKPAPAENRIPITRG